MVHAPLVAVVVGAGGTVVRRGACVVRAGAGANALGAVVVDRGVAGGNAARVLVAVGFAAGRAACTEWVDARPVLDVVWRGARVDVCRGAGAVAVAVTVRMTVWVGATETALSSSALQPERARAVTTTVPKRLNRPAFIAAA
ncbi:MAG TPA: hypothetical protein VG502_00620 [Flexivirga sp.]|uniref:hypothetical protein n=1 Tax=Flexivirga sp. TaxID=1962927 RepID=UPI002BDDD642|nr:hypothetical protein [Flexivirga sp.]HWC20775.1 hypothetical protein [Flexivirga sp.]